MKLRDLGSLNAPILVVGGGPTRQDVLEGQVFSSSQAWKCFSMLRDAGLTKRDCFFTNLVDRTVFTMDREGFDEAVKRREYSREEIEAGMARVREIAASMPNLKLITPLGNYPMRTFLQQDANDVSKVRGSVYTTNVNGRPVKCIPMLDPHKVKNHQQWERRARLDWIRAAEDITFPDELCIPKREHNINPSLEDIQAFIAALRPTDVISLDIETWGGSIKCVGFAASPHRSLVIPTEAWYWAKKGEERGAEAAYAERALAIAWRYIRTLCGNGNDKVLQNGLFDAWWLEEYGIPLRGYYWDTLGMHHALYPTDSHSLDYLASIYTRQPYWKDEAKAADEIVRVAKQGMDKLYVYNGLDVTVTHELFGRLYDELESRDRLGFYLRHYADMHPSLLRLMRGGVRVDYPAFCDARDSFVAQALAARDAAIEIAEKPLFTVKTQLEVAIYEAYRAGKVSVAEIQDELAARKDIDSVPKKFDEQQAKGISDQRLASVLWDDLGAPAAKAKKTKTGKRKVDNIALRTLKLDLEGRKRFNKTNRDKIVQLVDLALEHRRAHKLSTFVQPGLVDDDERLRCTYKFTTKTGRLASSGNPRGTGLNLQNIDRKLRYLFVPSPGNVLLEVDLSQAESRVVGVLTGHEEMIEQARVRPDKYDVHKANAALIYSALWQREVPIEEITYEMRYLGKRAVHAASYGMRGLRLSEILLKEGEVYTPAECQHLIDAYMEMRPAVRDWQAETRSVMGHRRRLYTSWGRDVQFPWIRFGDDDYRFGYSYIPQSEVGDLLNQYGLKPLDAYLIERQRASRIVLQVHDSVVVDAVPEEVYDVMVFLRGHLEQPRVYGQCLCREVELSIPAEYAIGTAWQQGKEWKALPPREEVETYVEEILNESAA
jgi:uracil-DNA glycosylase family 4